MLKRWTRGRAAAMRVMHRLIRQGALFLARDTYDLWRRATKPSSANLRDQRRWSASEARAFSLVVRVDDVASLQRSRAFITLAAQTYGAWELVGFAPGYTAGSRPSMIVDPRVRLVSVPLGASRADGLNASLRECHGDFAAVLDVDDALAPDALYEMARTLNEAPACDLVYSDEDLLDGSGRRHAPQFKPAWSPELLLARNYIGRLAMMRLRLVLELGGFRDGREGAEEWDLWLRLGRRSDRVRRVPQCLYHRGARAIEGVGAAVALGDHWRERGVASPSLSSNAAGWRSCWPLPRTPLVSIVIPSRDAAGLLQQCVRGVLDATSYPAIQLVIVDNGSTDEAVLEYYDVLRRERGAVIVPFDRPFNYSAACNAGADASSGELLLFLNNDTEVLHPDWLTELVRWAQHPDIGVVGGKLLYPDGTIQHAGVVFGLGLVGHIFSRAPEGMSGIFGSPETYRNYLAVTGACQMIRRELFETLGGYDERFRLTFSDIVLCLEARRAGYRTVYTPHASLRHYESYTRRRVDYADDLALLVAYLNGSGFAEDPYFHPELNAASAVPVVRPPFEPRPHHVVQRYMTRVLSRGAPRAASSA